LLGVQEANCFSEMVDKGITALNAGAVVSMIDYASSGGLRWIYSAAGIVCTF
jgi:hypothetical protein